MFGNKAQMQNMLKKARKMQEDLQKKQEELKKQTVDVSVGGRRCFPHHERRKADCCPEDCKGCH